MANGGTTCPPGDLSCLLKVLQDGQNALYNIKVTVDHCEQFYWGALSNEYTLPNSFNDAAPDLIAEAHQLEAAALLWQQHYRKAFGFKGQGLPSGQT